MIFEPTGIAGAWLITPEFRFDARGFFARTFCMQEFEAQGLASRFVQCNISRNTHRGTLRGMHFQADPHAETKLVRCCRGAIYDVIADLRKDSPTYRKWAAFELTEANCRALYVAAGLAHGFQTLADESEMFYQMGEFYYPELARGIRWNDPAFGIEWPIANPILSDRDYSYADFVP
jgi:dTDP-4-dehydrorhamnose 3,5-epimerase